MTKLLSFWPLYLYLAINAVGAWMVIELISDPLRFYQLNRNLAHLSESVAHAREAFWAFIEMFR